MNVKTQTQPSLSLLLYLKYALLPFLFITQTIFLCKQMNILHCKSNTIVYFLLECCKAALQHLYSEVSGESKIGVGVTKWSLWKVC